MSNRRGMGRLVIGLVGVVAAVGVAVGVRQVSRKAGPRAETNFSATTPLAELVKPLQEGEPKALAALFEKLTSEKAEAIKPLSESEAPVWIDTLKALRAGYPKFKDYARATAVLVAGRILDKFTLKEAPSKWAEALPPTHDLYTAGMSDQAMNVRAAALQEASRAWSWAPGRALMPVEERALAEWKDSLIAPAVRRLADPEPMLRAAAVACLGALPLSSAAMPALAYVNDSSPEVRRQVLSAFASRPALLTDEDVLRRLCDPDPQTQVLAQQVLKSRGLSQEQIGLGAMIVHPKPDVRESVIPLVSDRTDIDPVVWLIYLSRDELESIRIKAAEALSKRDTPEARQRLAEMAISDPSAAVKKVAVRLIAAGEETASLPPLPGSPSLTPKAN